MFFNIVLGRLYRPGPDSEAIWLKTRSAFGTTAMRKMRSAIRDTTGLFPMSFAKVNNLDTKKEIRSLTGLRGIAACYVVSYHAYHNNVTGLLGTLLHHGYLAVDLFFVLSGFIMTRTYGQVFRYQITGKAFAVYLCKRLARIYPLYLLTLIVAYIIAQSSFDSPPNAYDFVANLLMINTWKVAPTINPPSWTISTEFAAYLLFPFLIAPVLKWKQWAAIALLLVSFVTLCIVAFESYQIMQALGSQAAEGSRTNPLDPTTGKNIFPLIRCLTEFIMGMVAFRFALSTKADHILKRTKICDAMALLILILLCIPYTDLIIIIITHARSIGINWSTTRTRARVFACNGEFSEAYARKPHSARLFRHLRTRLLGQTDFMTKANAHICTIR